jgi:protein-S-isoprenylcysteine O-methyltransferase Ste14
MTLNSVVIGFIYGIATGSRRVRAILTPIGAVVALCFIALFVAAALLADWWFELPPLLPVPLNIAAALPLLLIGLAIYVLSLRQFFRSRGTPVPFNPPPVVMTTGPYKYCRNPMGDSIFLVMLGLGLVLRSVSLVCFVTPLFVLLFAWEIKAVEEPELVRRLGEDYIKYRRETPMFIPRWGAGSGRKRDV